MNKRLLGVSGAALVLAALLAGPSRAALVVVDFESLATTTPGKEVASGFQEDGFVFTSNIDPGLASNAFSVWEAGNEDKIGASTALFSSYEAVTVTFGRGDNTPFTLETMELGPVSHLFLDGSLTFQGVKSNSQTVSRTFTLSGAFAFTLLDFGADPQNGGSFDDLVSVSFRNDFPAYQFDNIQAEVAAVPEPSTALLAVAGLAMLGLWRAQVGRKVLQRIR